MRSIPVHESTSNIGYGLSTNLYFSNWFSLNAINPSIDQVFNSTQPYGYNNGSIFEANGLVSRISAGLFIELGPLSVQFQPEYLYSQNLAFKTFPEELSNEAWQIYSREVRNRIDAPDRFTEGSYSRSLLGHSSVRLNYRSFSAGISNEYLWWGPAMRSSLLLTDNAEGFLHFTFNSTRPQKVFFGKVEWQYILGRLDPLDYQISTDRLRSNDRPYLTAKPNDWRLITGFNFVWHPVWIEGLTVGINRTFIGYGADLNSRADYFPLFQPLRKEAFQTDDNVGGDDSFDQRLSVFFRWLFVNQGLEIYAEYGREDHSADLRDLFLEPEHSRAFILGIQKLNKLSSNDEIAFGAEFAQLGTTSTTTVRPAPSWYVHHIVRHGYTHNGQIIGSGYGIGGAGQFFWIDYMREDYHVGLNFERIEYNNDLFNYFGSIISVNKAFSLSPGLVFRYKLPFAYMSLNLNSVRFRNQFYFDETSNGESIEANNIRNIHVRFSLRYMFDR